MEQIIQQIVSDFVKRVMKNYLDKGIYELGAMADDTLDMAKNVSKELLKAFIEYTDRSLVSLNKERKRDEIKVHERNVSRSLLTSLGEFTYERTYFKTKEGMRYLIDHLIDVESYERVDSHVSSKLVNESARVSFGRSASIVTGGMVSRQTVWRKAMESGEAALLPERAAKTPERIHIFADEDHAHLQEGNGTILPLVTICSGKRRVSEGRNELIDKTHLCGYGIKPEIFWDYVYALCNSKYDMSNVKEVFLYGDGASWIDSSKEYFPYATRVLDSYHYEKKMKVLSSGDICKRYTLSLRAAVSAGDKAYFESIVSTILKVLREEMTASKERTKKLRGICDARNYLVTRWDSVINMRHAYSIGSCTEALVSHVFSERFSRNPMGWSKPGIAKMSQIRVYHENGCNVLPSDIGLGKNREVIRHKVPTYIKKYEELVKEQREEFLGGARDWRLFEHEHVEWVAPSGTKVALDALARMRNIA